MYKQQLQYMMSLYSHDKNVNIIKDFFAQLAQVDRLDIFPIINAISSNEKELKRLIHDCIDIRPWMTKISLEDIRNVIVFVLWRDHKIMCNVEDGMPENEDVQYLIRPSNGYTDNLIGLMETCFYIEQIHFIKQFLTNDSDRFLLYLVNHYHRNGLKETVYRFAKLITPLHQTF